MINLIEKVLTKVAQLKIAHSSNPRPSSEPFISGDSFRSIADHIHDETDSVVAENIKQGDVVFIKTDRIDEFFSQIHPKIKNRYKIITHNSDRNIGSTESGKIDEKIIHWFAQNVSVSHPKITPLPIGLENAHYAKSGRVSLYNLSGVNSGDNKKDALFVNFNVNTNKDERIHCLEVMKKSAVADVSNNRLTQGKFSRLLASYKMVVSPPGNGIDCHRTWEALYLRTAPVVKRSVATEYFFSIGLPLVLVNDWNELSVWDNDRVNSEYTKLMSKADFSPLSFDWWKNRIEKAS